MNENHIADVWLLFKEYIDRKTLETVADRYVELLADYGISDKVMQGACGNDEVLDKAIDYYLENSEIEDEEDYYEDEEDY